MFALKRQCVSVLQRNILPSCRSLSGARLFATTISSSPLHTVESLKGLNAPPEQIFTLHNLADNPGARKKGRRIGRGPGSSKGKTAGRGMKGKKAREGKKNHVWFEGGQSPLFRRSPKFGFKNALFKEQFSRLNMNKLIQWCKAGRIDPSKTITLKALQDSGAIGNSRIKHGIKLLGRGSDQLAAAALPPLQVEVTHCSASAKKAIEDAGGKVTLVYFTRLTLRAHLTPEKFDILPRTPAIIPRKKREGRYAPYLDHHRSLVDRDRARGHGGDNEAKLHVDPVKAEKRLPRDLRPFFEQLKTIMKKNPNVVFPAEPASRTPSPKPAPAP